MTLVSAPPILFLATTDLHRCQQFYEETLGLPCMEYDPSALVFDAGGIMLRISPLDHVNPQPYTVLGWQVEDIAASMAELTEAGISFARFDVLPQDEDGVWTADDDTRIAWFYDPDGHLLSLTEW